MQSQSELFAQPFIPTQDGALVDISLSVVASIPYEFAGAQVHEYPVGGTVATVPVPGGLGNLSFVSASGADATATATFPDRPYSSRANATLS